MHTNPMLELIGSLEHDWSVQSIELDKQFDEFKKHGKVCDDDKERELCKTYFHHNCRYLEYFTNTAYGSYYIMS